MNKEMIYQLGQEAIATLKSADETRIYEVTTGHSIEESDNIPRPKKKEKG